MKNLSEIIKIASIFVGAILGAGFAGGRELVTFFVRFGRLGIIGVIIAGFLFMFLGATILYKSHSKADGDYKKYLQNILPENIAYLVNAFSELFLVCSFIIMLSGSSALFKEHFSFPLYSGSLITTFITFIILSLGTKGLAVACSFLTPIMLIGILYVDISSLIVKATPVSMFYANIKDNFFFSSVLYVSYNMLSCAPVLVSASTIARNKRNALLGGILGGMALLCVAFLSCLTLFLSDSQSLFAELPMLIIAGNLSKFSQPIYAIVLYMAILTTAFSCGLPIVKKLHKLFKYSPLAAFVLCIVSYPLSFFKFSVLVNYCYTFFGFLGLILIGAIIFNLFKKRRFIEKNKEFSTYFKNMAKNRRF